MEEVKPVRSLEQYSRCEMMVAWTRGKREYGENPSESILILKVKTVRIFADMEPKGHRLKLMLRLLT